MTLASLLTVDDPPRARRRRGRPHASTVPAARERHIDVAWDFLFNGEPAEAVAATHDVSRTSVYEFTDRALEYDDPRSVVLRQIARGRLPGRN